MNLIQKLDGLDRKIDMKCIFLILIFLFVAWGVKTSTKARHITENDIGEEYAKFTHTDHLIYVDEEDDAYGVCMSRDLEKYCPEIYPPIGKIYRRISEDVIELNKGNYWCRTKSLPIIKRKRGSNYD